MNLLARFDKRFLADGWRTAPDRCGFWLCWVPGFVAPVVHHLVESVEGFEPGARWLWLAPDRDGLAAAYGVRVRAWNSVVQWNLEEAAGVIL